MCLSFSAPPPVSRRTAMNKQQCGKAPASLVSMAARADATHPRAPQGSVSSSRGRLSATPSCFCLSVLNHPSSKCAAAVLGLIAAHRTGTFSAWWVRLCKERLQGLDSSCVALETTKSTTTTTTKKRQENYWLCRFLLFCFRCHLRSMFVKKKNVRVVFVKYYDTDVQKK